MPWIGHTEATSNQRIDPSHVTAVLVLPYAVCSYMFRNFWALFSVPVNVQAKKTKIRQHKHSSRGNSLGHLARILGQICHSCELKPCRSGHQLWMVSSVPDSLSLDEFTALPARRETLRTYPHLSALPPVLVCSIGQKCNTQCYLGEKWLEMNGTDKNARPAKWNI